MNSNFMLALQSSAWSINTAIIMIISNLTTIVIGRYSIKTRSVGPSIPILGLDGLKLPELIATTSLGHIIGAGAIIGLKSINIIT